MQRLTEGTLLHVWEAGRAMPPPRKALTMLLAGLPEETYDQVSRLTIGERDRRLVQLRALTFGPMIQGVSHCQLCHEQMEINVDTQTMTSPPCEAEPRHMPVTVHGHQIIMRSPTTADLIELKQGSSRHEARRALVRQCVVKAERNGLDLSPDGLPLEVLDAIPPEMADADPMAELRLEITCPSCQRSSAVLFDIVQYFWDEIVAAAKRILSDIHGLARAYGWSEPEILAVPPMRRRLYLEMVGA